VFHYQVFVLENGTKYCRCEGTGHRGHNFHRIEHPVLQTIYKMMMLQIEKCILWNKQLTATGKLNTQIWHISPRIGKHMTTFSFFETHLQSSASKNFPTFMEWTKIQHSHSQQYTTTSKHTQSTSSHHTSLQSILILYAHLCLGLSGLLPLGFLTEVGYISHLTVLDYLVTHRHP